MDTPTIAKYYREKDPMERLKLLEQSIAAGEEPDENTGIPLPDSLVQEVRRKR